MKGLVLGFAVASMLGCSSAVPVREPPTGVERARVVVGPEHSCALTTSGEVWCWGRNDLGQLGDGTTVERHDPVRVAGLDGIAGLSTDHLDDQANAASTCAWTEGGDIWCWGYELADGWPDLEYDILEPARVAQVEGLRGLSDRILAWRVDGTLVFLGTPRCESDLEGVVGALVHGAQSEPDEALYRAEAWLADGSVWAPWFEGCGDDQPRRSTWPGGVAGMEMGTEHSCAWRLDGTAGCWGSNEAGKLGDGTTEDRDTPVTVVGLASVVGIAAGRQHTCAWLEDGTAWCWGWNGYGQLGDGTLAERHQPVQVLGLEGVVAMSSRGFHTCAYQRDESIWCWGSNSYGQLGDGTTEDRPTPVRVELP